MSTVVRSPVSGTAVAMSAVPDPVFAQAMVGPGVAIEPAEGRSDAVAPIAGKVVTLHPHAFVIADADGKGVLVHLGIDTVKRKGDGFAVLVAQGETVRAGQPLVTWDPAEVRVAGYSAVVPVVALDATAEQLAAVVDSGPIATGDALFEWS